MKVVKKIVFLLLALFGIIFFLPINKDSSLSFLVFCRTCPIYAEGFMTDVSFIIFIKEVFLGIFYYSAATIPIFATATLIAALIKKKIFLQNPILAFLSAAILPICSCAAFPFVTGYNSKNSIEELSKLLFLITAPILSPVIIILSLKILGLYPTIIRIIFSFIFAFLTSIIIIIFTSKKNKKEKSVFRSGINLNTRSRNPINSGSDNFYRLLKYLFLGIVITSLLIFLVPKNYTKWFFSKNILSAFLVSLVGIPIHLCNGGDIISIAPFIYSGMPVGAGIAFGITGTGICFTSIPLLYKVLKTKGFILYLISFIIIPPILAIALNIIFPIIPLAQRGF